MGLAFAYGAQERWIMAALRQLSPSQYDYYPRQVPSAKQLSNGLDGCSVFSKIVLVKGYHQIPVTPEDIPEMAIITPVGLFEYLFTPFGLSNAPQTFQKMIDRTCANLEGTFRYMDDT
jgi:cytoskeleton-associated protein 5